MDVDVCMLSAVFYEKDKWVSLPIHEYGCACML